MVARAWRRAAAVAPVLLVVAGCTAAAPAAAPTPSPASGNASIAPSAAPTTTPAGPACPTPAIVGVAPTDFPHPELTRHPPAPASAADTALAQQGLAALTAFGGPISASAFQHYLDASGQFLTLPVDGLLSANPAFVTELDGILVATATAAVMQAAAGPTCTSVAFSSGWRPHDDVADPDWHYTLGRFSLQVLGIATRDSAAVRVTYRAAIGDTYNFDPGTTFAQFEQLALDGHAADFLDGGLTAVRSATVHTAAELATPGFG